MTKKLLIWLVQLAYSFSGCALLFGLKRKGVILYEFKATCSLVNTGLTPLVSVRLSVQMEFDTKDKRQLRIRVVAC